MRGLPYLVDEGGELVVESLYLLTLFFSHPLDGGVNLQVEGSQETLVDSDLLDASRGAGGEARATKAPSNATPIAKSTTTPTAKAAPEATTPTNGDPFGPPQVVKAAASKASPSATDPAQSPAVPCGAGHGDRAEAGAPCSWGSGRGSAEAPAIAGVEGDGRLPRHGG
jgi:hypothetical protein